ncbi:MYXO-CTERM sorting domain-containing protein [Myxococcota bacterium]
MPRLLAAILLCSPITSWAATVTLQNDGWTSGGEVFCQGGFVTGEEAAVTLGPVVGTFTVESVEFVFCGATTEQTVTLKIYEDTGASDPGTLLYTNDYQVTGSDEALHQIDLSAQDVRVTGGGSIRVSLLFSHSGVPSVSRDDDGISNARNWIKSQGVGWVQSWTLGLTGDWVIRAVVVTPDHDSNTTGDSDGAGDASDGSCTTHDDCGGGQLCEDGRCVIICSVNEDCRGGEVCENSRCVAIEEGCDCAMGSGPGVAVAFIAGLASIGRRRRKPL